MRRLTGLAALPVAFAAAVAVPAAGATAAPVPAAPTSTSTTTAATADFYRAPSPLPAGAPGQLIRSRSATVQLGPGAPSTRAWTVMYHSRSSRGADIAVTGTVLRPTAAWSGTGPRPVVSFAVGTQGLGPQCAPSKQLLQSGAEYEASNISAALQRGWAVVVTDYEGYTTGSTPTYVAGRSEGHTVLDAVRAAGHLTGSGVTAKNPLAIWGYSQGGGASAWATVLQPSYAPELKLVGDASGGVPADAKAVGDSLNARPGAAFLLYSVVGFAAAYPAAFPLYPHLNAAGRTAVATVKTQCVSQSLATFANKDVSSYLANGETVAQFEAIPSVAQVLRDNTLTTKALLPQVPVFQYHGAADEIVPFAQARTLHTTWCAKGVRTSFTALPGEHLTTNSEAAPLALSFLSDRFAGKAFTPLCTV